MDDYSFRPITPFDKKMFVNWLTKPHIEGWWQDGETEWALIEPEFDNPDIAMNIVEHDSKPFAFVQDYDAQLWPLPQYAGLPKRTRAIDMFLGDSTYLGQGHASGFLAQRLSQLRQSTPQIVTDPDPANTRAISTYTRAGFRPLVVTACEDGTPVQVMTHP